MKLWTEVVTEDVGVVHVGTRRVLVPLSEDIDEMELRAIMKLMKQRVMYERQKERFAEITRKIERRKRTRERLREAGYNDGEIPL